MPVPESLSQFLHSLACPYRLHQVRARTLPRIVAELAIVPGQFVMPYFLISQRAAWLMALVPADRELDLERISALLQRPFTLAEPHEISERFAAVSEPGAAHPFASLYPLPAIVDRSVLTNRWLYTYAGCANSVISLPADAFLRGFEKTPKVVISNASSRAPGIAEPAQYSDQRVASLTATEHGQGLPQRLPPMPAMASKLIVMVQNPDVEIADLAAVIELDPTTAAQLIGYARSPLFGYRGKVDSVDVAISRVLGLDRVRKLALAIATTRAFSIPAQGPLGLRAFWRHALYAGLLSQALAQHCQGSSLDGNTLYLCGLLHNVGILVLGHLYRGDYKLLTRFVERHPELSLCAAEQRVAEAVHGSGGTLLRHDALGATLLQTWHLPDEVVACCQHHHDADYAGPHADYVQLVRLANQLLAREQVGDERCDNSVPISYPLGLSADTADQCLQIIVSKCHDIDDLANSLVA